MWQLYSCYNVENISLIILPPHTHSILRFNLMDMTTKYIVNFLKLFILNTYNRYVVIYYDMHSNFGYRLKYIIY